MGLEAARKGGWQIIGIERHEARGYLLDLSGKSGLHVDAQGLLET